MANSDPELRKLIKFGNSSFIISIPKGWINKHKLKKGDYIHLTENEDGELNIYPKEKRRNSSDEEEKRFEIDVTNITLDDLKREVTSAYIGNYKTFNIKGKNLGEKAGQIRRVFQTLIGLEILEHSNDEMIIRDFLNLDTVSPKRLMRRIDNSIRSIFEDIKEGVNTKAKLRQELYQEIQNSDNEINKLHFLVLKISKLGMHDESIRKSFEMSYAALSSMHGTSLLLEYIGDDLKRIAMFLTKVKLNDKQRAQFIELFTILEKSYLDIMLAYHNGDTKLAKTVFNIKPKLMKECDNLFKISTNNITVGSLIERSKTLYAGIWDIAKLMIY